MMKRLLSFLLVLCAAATAAGAQVRELVWPAGRMPDAQPQQIAAMTDVSKAKDFKPDEWRRPYIEWADAPKAELVFRIVHEGTYQIRLCFGPSNPVEKGFGQCFGLLLDGEALPGTNGEAVRDSLPAGFIAGDYNSPAWCRGVLDNIRVVTYTAMLSAGTHSLLYIGADAGVLLQRVELLRDPE